MMKPARAWATLVVLMPLMALAQDVPVTPPTPTPLSAADTAAALSRAERLGKAIFLQDLAAERATDAIRAKYRAFGKDTRVRGWITEEHDGQYRVSYIDATPAVLYRIEMDADGTPAGEVQVLSEPAPLSAYETAAATARSLAMTAQVAPCAKTYNSVALPEDDGRWAVYLLPATTLPNVVPLGGSHRLDIADGRITASRGFTRTCIQLGRTPSKRGVTVVGMMVTHLLDPTPTEVHVYWSLWARTPMYVATTDGQLWEIREGRIHKRDDLAQAPESGS